MRLSTVRNDAGEPTLSLDHFERRHYTTGLALGISIGKYKGFYGELLEVHQCNEVMDSEVVSRIISELSRKYETPDTEVVLISDNSSLHNENIVEIHAVKVLEYETNDGSTIKTSNNTVVIFKKHKRDGYVEAILKLAYEMEFGEGSYYGS